jgi:hypothetical protein
VILALMLACGGDAALPCADGWQREISGYCVPTPTWSFDSDPGADSAGGADSDPGADSAGGADSGPASGCEDAPEVTWTSWGDGFFASYCRSCHSVDSPNRFGAPAGVDFDTEAQVGDWLDRIRARTLEEGTMPVGGGVLEADLLLLGWLLDCYFEASP